MTEKTKNQKKDRKHSQTYKHTKVYVAKTTILN